MLEAMVAASAALSRVLQRMLALAHSARYNSDGTVDQHVYWSTTDLRERPALIAGLPLMSLSGGIGRVLDVQARLLAACASGDEIDPLWVCRVLQALDDENGQDFSPAVRRMAAITGAQLPATPRDMHNGLGLREHMEPGEWRPVAPYAVASTQDARPG